MSVKWQGTKINTQKALALLCANDKHIDKEIRKTITLMATSKNDNQDKPNQGTKELYNGNFKHRRNEWTVEDFSCLRIGKINNIKMATLLTVVSNFNTIPLKIHVENTI